MIHVCNTTSTYRTMEHIRWLECITLIAFSFNNSINSSVSFHRNRHAKCISFFSLNHLFKIKIFIFLFSILDVFQDVILSAINRHSRHVAYWVFIFLSNQFILRCVIVCFIESKISSLRIVDGSSCIRGLNSLLTSIIFNYICTWINS